MALSDELRELQRFYEHNGIRHFFAKNTVRLRNPKWTGPSHVVPDRDQWANIVPTLKVADAIREAWGSPVLQTSGFRPIPYNRLIHSKDTSMHPKFRALDLRPENGNWQEFFRVAKAAVEGARAAGMIVGLGLYYDSSPPFVHVDTGFYDWNRDWDDQ